MNSTYRGMVAVGLLLLMTTYYVQVNCFVHSHIVNGVTIIHSHVHRNAHHSSEDGGHNDQEITLIAQLQSQLLLTEAAPSASLQPALYCIQTICAISAEWALQTVYTYTDGRAPPMTT